MPLKTIKARREAKKKETRSVEEILDNVSSASPAGISSATKLIKALKIQSTTANTNKLYNMLVKEMDMLAMDKYVHFLQDEWYELKTFVPNYGTRGSNLVIDWDTASLIQYHSVFTSLFKTYNHSEAEYKGRIGLLDNWEVAKEDANNNLPQKIEQLRTLNKRAAKDLTAKSKEIEDLKAEIEHTRKSYARCRRFAIFYQRHVASSLSEDEILDYIEDGKIIDKMKSGNLSYMFD